MRRAHHWLGIGMMVVGGLGWIALCPATTRAESYAVDPVHSTVLFRIKHLGTSLAWGRFNDIGGRLNLDDKSPFLEVQVKTDSLDTANAKRDQHLRGPDFFNVKQFPMISFKSKRITRSGDNGFDVEGTLSLHGVERPLKVKLERTGAGKSPMGAAIAGYAANFSINRSDFGMKYMLEGLSDEVVLVVSLECAAQ